MKKLFIPMLLLSVPGCASQQGLVTPNENSYTVEATAANAKQAKKIALDTAKKTCKDIGKSFFVISQDADYQGAGSLNIDQKTTDLTNVASQLLLGGNLLSSEHTVNIEFNCK